MEKTHQKPQEKGIKNIKKAILIGFDRSYRLNFQ